MLYLLRRGRLPSKAKPGHARTNENHASPETLIHSTTRIQYMQSGTEFSIQSTFSNEQSHLCTSIQHVSTSCRFICIAGLKVLSFSLYIMTVILVCSFCACWRDGYLSCMCIVCSSSFISSSYSVFTAFLSLDWFLDHMFANKGGNENIKIFFQQHSKQSSDKMSKKKKAFTAIAMPAA